MKIKLFTVDKNNLKLENYGQMSNKRFIFSYVLMVLLNLGKKDCFTVEISILNLFRVYKNNTKFHRTVDIF